MLGSFELLSFLHEIHLDKYFIIENAKNKIWAN